MPCSLRAARSRLWPRRWQHAAALPLLALLVAGSARADTPAPDQVLLKDGTTLQGTLVTQKPGQFVVIRTADGAQQTIAWDDVKRVVASAPPAGAGDTTTVDASRKGVTVDATRDCAESSDERCQQRLHASTEHGLAVGVSGERIVKLKEPGNSYRQIAIDGGFLYGHSSKDGAKLNVYGGGANFNFQYRIGGKLPGQDGGTWSGFGIDLTGGIFGAGVVTSFMGSTDGAGFLLINSGLSLGYQFLAFGRMNEDSLKQHGFGFFVGGRAGVANTQVFSSQTSSTTNAQYGPQIQISFPEYNFGTAQRAAFYISAYVLPTGDFLMANIQAGGSFN